MASSGSALELGELLPRSRTAILVVDAPSPRHDELKGGWSRKIRIPVSDGKPSVWKGAMGLQTLSTKDSKLMYLVLQVKY